MKFGNTESDPASDIWKAFIASPSEEGPVLLTLPMMGSSLHTKGRQPYLAFQGHAEPRSTGQLDSPSSRGHLCIVGTRSHPQTALPGKTANWAAIPLPLGGSLATQEQQLVVFSLKEQQQEWRPVFQEELDLSRLPGAEAWRQPLALGTSPGIPRPTREWAKAGLWRKSISQITMWMGPSPISPSTSSSDLDCPPPPPP